MRKSISWIIQKFNDAKWYHNPHFDVYYDKNKAQEELNRRIKFRDSLNKTSQGYKKAKTQKYRIIEKIIMYKIGKSL